MSTLYVHGIPDPAPGSSPLQAGLPGRVTVKHAARVDSARGGQPRLTLDGVLDEDVVEIELEDGFRMWSRGDTIEEDFGLRRSRDAAGDGIELPTTLSLGGPSRGVTGWAIKALKVLGVDIAGDIATFVAAHVEGRLQPGPGLYRCSQADVANLSAVGGLGPATGPTLVFLHGTASSTSGSFGHLWTGGAAAPIQQLFRRYDGRVLALQHETLTKSPIENARAVARGLLDSVGKGAEIHLVSHSRGGLIGELLARAMRVGSAPFTPDEIALFAEQRRAGDRAALVELNQLLQEAGFRITRFVRVACPARGTTLADGRLDRYFSILVNLAWLVPGLRENPVYDGLTSVLAGVLKQRTNPEELPGLEAQMPGSPLVRMLNRPGVKTDADLHVLGGDLAGAGVWGRLKTFATDLYYREDHDLVVPTPAMLGGAERTGGIQYWLDTGPDVTHFHYFAHPDTASRLVAALTSDKADFHALEVQPFAVTANDYRKRAPVPQPVVFVLPGVMGSELRVDDASVWMEVFALAAGGMSRLAPGAKVTASGLVRSGYGELCRYLSATHEVIPFPYDWRLPVEESAKTFREALDAKIPQAEAQRQPVRIIAHSMGGLVVRAMLATPKGQATWARMCRHDGARFIMLGTPNRGSHAIAAMLMGRDALVKKLALLDLRNDYAGLLQTIAAFDGVLDLLPDTGPADQGMLDLFDRAVWQALHDQDVPRDRGLFSSSVASEKSAGFKWVLPTAAALADAKRMRSLVASSPLDPARVIYVAGTADETACDVRVDPGAPAGRRVSVLASAHGDGRVLWSTGIPPGLRVYYMDAVHGDMASTDEAFPALLDLLNAGSTSKLPSAPPARRSAAGERFPLRDPMPAMIPDQEELVISALGGTRRRTRAAAPRPPVRVRVIHDNLANATAPVLVGHYQHDVIVSAEAYLDRQLAGRLTELHRMDLYPGAIGTAVAVLNDAEGALSSVHPGAVVAGLGTVGDLTPGALTTTLVYALTRYGAECVGRERRRRQREGGEGAPSVLRIPVAALLVGSGETGVPLAEVVQAIWRAVTQANERLRLPAMDGEGTRSGIPPLTAYIDRVDLLELFEDRAIEAVYALRNQSRSGQLENAVIEEHLVCGAEGQRRARADTAQDWWQRIRVRKGRDGHLEFEPMTQLAGAKASIQETQRRLVDQLLARAASTTAFDPALGYTLFEMLVPNELKSHAPDRRKLVLMLDSAAAALPWELLHDRQDPHSPPLAVAGGMVRQLLLPETRERVTRAAARTALVVGNPVVSDQRFAPLPGASAEANAVAKVLQAQGYDVLRLIEGDAQPLAVFSALHKQPWQIVHLAAHGVFEFPPSGGGGRSAGSSWTTTSSSPRPRPSRCGTCRSWSSSIAATSETRPTTLSGRRPFTAWPRTSRRSSSGWAPGR